MGKLFTLDSLREEVEKKYAPIEVDYGADKPAQLSAILRLPKGPRDKVLEELDRLQETSDVDEMQDCAVNILSLVSPDGGRLVEAIGADLALTMAVLEAWMESTQPGEAGNSPSS
jgi:hypothetical protein